MNADFLKKSQPKGKPKSKWVKAERDGVTSYSDAYAKCPFCNHVSYMGWWMKFCPECGQKMTVEPVREHITFEEFRNIMISHNASGATEPLFGVIVYKESNWDRPYSLEARSYRVSSDNRAFQMDKIANSIFAECLDGSDINVRLDWYNWDIDYCYIEDGKDD